MLLRTFFLAGSVSIFLEPEFLEAILERAERQAEKLCRLGYVVVRPVHCLHYQAALDVFEVDAFGREFELGVAVGADAGGVADAFGCDFVGAEGFFEAVGGGGADDGALRFC